MKKFFSVALVLTLIMTMFAGVSQANEEAFANESSSKNAAFDFIEGELIVSIEPIGSKSRSMQASLVSEEAKLKGKGFTILSSLHNEVNGNEIRAYNVEMNETIINNLGLVYLVSYSQKEYGSIQKAKAAITKELASLGFKVKNVSENYKVYAIEGEDLFTVEDEAIETMETVQSDVSINMHNNQRWHYEMIKAPQAWTITEGSSAVKIAVLDTGIDHNHVSLTNYVNTNLGRSFVGGTTMDRNGHGTHVAGTIASYGVVSGVMKNATLIPVKVLNDSGSGSTYGIIDGVLYASSIGADVINMSLGGGGYVPEFDNAIRTAVSRGTIVVAAAGNDGRSSISYPAAYSDSFAVGSVTSSRARSSFSNYGNGLDVMAPGSSIYSTWPNNSYNTISGTSMATPHVAGVAGLIRAINPTISVNNAKNIMRNTAQPAGSFFEYGYGIVDAYASVIAASGGQQLTTTTTVTTNYPYYYRGENVIITATVKNQSNQPLQGATVTFTITRPNGTTLSQAATTNSSGIATWTIGSNSSTALGTYRVKADTTLSGYAPSSATTTFEFR